MDRLFETESETSDKEADNYNCVLCKKMYIDNTEAHGGALSCQGRHLSLLENFLAKVSTWKSTKLLFRVCNIFSYQRHNTNFSIT